MIDQATRLRGLMESRFTAIAGRAANGAPFRDPEAGPQADAPAARVVAVTSGKGGVGKSNIALNVAVALRRAGKRVCLLDANFGLANIDLLCGLNGYWNLAHVVSGARNVADVLLQGPEGVRVVSGGSAIAQLRNESGDPEARSVRIADALHQLAALEEEHDFLVIDTGTGIHQHVRPFVAAADAAVLVATPEPTAIADAYATVKALSGHPPANILAVVNQAASSSQAQAILERLQQTARLFLHAEILPGGWIPADPALPDAVVRRTPLLIDSPRSAAAESIEKLAQRIKAVSENHAPLGRYFARLLARHEGNEGRGAKIAGMSNVVSGE